MSLSMISLYRNHIFDVHTPKYVYDIFIYRLMVNKDMTAQPLDKEQLYGMLIMLNLSIQVQKITPVSCPHSFLITGFVAKVTRWVSHAEQQLLSLPGYLSSTTVLAGYVVLDF